MDDFVTPCESPSIDIDDCIKKLAMMGFTNEEDVRNALEITNYDINEAISLLMYKYVELTGGISEEHYEKTVQEASPVQETPESSDKVVSSSEIPDTIESLIVGHDLNTEFSSVEFNHLRARVFTDQWDIPCLRSQPLGKCLLGAIRLLRENGMKALDMDPECREFAFNCLPECVTKLMTSQAVYNWDRDTLEGVHNMLELTVRLLCQYFTAFKEMLMEEPQRRPTSVDSTTSDSEPVKVEPIRPPQSALSRIPPSAVHFAMESLRLLTLIFDCEANYHQLCRDRNSYTGTYADPFNDWSSIAERVNENEALFSETLPSPRNFYLVNLLNCFGVFGGFKFLRWLGTQPWTSVNMMTSLLSPLASCADYLTEFTLRQEFGVVVLQRVLWRLSNLNEDDFKDRDSRIFDVVTHLRILVYRLVDLNISQSLSPFLVPHDESDDYHCVLTVREPNWEALSLASMDESNAVNHFSSTPISASVVIQEVDRLHCTLLLAALSPPRGAAGASFNGRMLALRNLVEQLEAAKLAAEATSNYQSRNDNMITPMRRRPVVHQYSSANLLASENAAFLARRAKRRAIRLDHLMSWLRDREVILKSMHNLDNTAYMTSLGQLFRLLGERLTTADLTTVWHRTTNQTGAAVDNILTLLTDVAATRFIQPQLDHLFYLVEASWMNLNRQAQAILSARKHTENVGDRDRSGTKTGVGVCFGDEPSHVRHARARLLNLVGRIGTVTKESWKADMCVDLLWHIAHGTCAHRPSTPSTEVSTSSEVASQTSRTSIHIPVPCNYRHPEPIEAALAQQLVILREFRCSGVDQRLRAMRWLSQAVEHVSKNLLTFFMLAYVKSLVELILKNFVGRAKRDNLNELIRSHDLITQVVASLLRYEHWAIESHGDLLSADSQDELGFRHSELVKRHFELLHFLLKNAELTLNVERAKSLWENLIGHPRVAAYDREQCFAWFTASMSHLEPEAQTMLFTKLILKSHPALFRSYAGFECFKAFFEKVNLHEGRMKQVSKLWHVDKPDLIGLDFLWDLYLALPSLDASLDGIHMNTVFLEDVAQPESNRTLSSSTDPMTSSGTLARSQSTPKTSDTSVPAIGSPMIEPNAVKLARQLLLDVHWGQLTPKLRRDASACYKRFFDACRRRLEANWAAGRGMVPKRGVHSALAETGQLLAALIIGPAAAGRAKHCSRTAARLALRRLLGLVHAYIQTVEDEMFGSRVLHPTWRPHGTTFRGWELRLPLHVETLRPGQTSPTTVRLISPEPNISAIFSPFDTSLTPSKKSPEAAQSICLLVHSNEILGSVRDRSNLVSTALLYANRLSAEGIAGSFEATYSQSCPNWSTSALYLGPVCTPDGSDLTSPQATKSDVRTGRSSGSRATSLMEPISSSRDTTARRGTSEPCTKRILETVLNRKPVGELGFQNGRQLTVRLIASLNGRTNTRSGRLTANSPGAASALTMSICSTSPSMASMVNQGSTSEADLVARAAAALHSGTEDSDRLVSGSSNPTDALFVRREDNVTLTSNLSANPSASSSATQLARGLSMLSLSSNPPSSLSGAASSIVDLTSAASTNQTTATVITTTLPSLCLGEDIGVYELLIELAEAELVHMPMFPTPEGKKAKSLTSGIQASAGVSLSSSFSLIHPIRLLLATLPTCPAAALSRSGSQLQQSLFCSPTTLLKSTPYRTLYKLQILSASLIPVDSTPWWNISPGCLLSPPSQLYINTTPPPIPPSIAAGSHGHRRSMRSSVIHRVNDFESGAVGGTVASETPFEVDSSAPAPTAPNSDTKWFMSSESFAFPSSNKLESTSAPSSPVFRRRRNFKLFGNQSVLPSDSGPFKSRTNATRSSFKNTMTLLANVSPMEYLEPLVQLLHRQLRENESEIMHSVAVPLVTSSGSPNQSTLSANISWWRREVRYLCLQLLAFLLNPHRHQMQNYQSSQGGYRPSVISNASWSLSAPMSIQYLTPAFGSALLSALLDTAVVSAGISEKHPHRQTGLGPNTSPKHSGLAPIYQPNKDSRAGVAGLFEVTTSSGLNLLYQDVEVAVQSIHLLVQCVLAYPKQLLDSFLALDRLEDKLIRLLLYSPSVRIRAETARQLEQLSLISSRYLRIGELCVQEWDFATHPDLSGSIRCEVTDSPCFTHNHIAHPNVLQFLLRLVFPARIPIYINRIDVYSHQMTTLMAQSAEYFRVRGFLIGQTPVSLLQSWIENDHVTLLREELSWFRSMIDSDMNWTKEKYALCDCLLAGHLESARLICAQTVACVISHASCTLAHSPVANGATSTRGKSDPTSRGSIGGGGIIPNPTHASYDSRFFDVPLVLLEALNDPNWKDTGSAEHSGRSSTTSHPLISLPEDLSFPVSGLRALQVSTQCLRVARDFLYYLLTECLFPAASHILQHRSSKGPHTLTTTLAISLSSLRSLDSVPLHGTSIPKRTDPARECPPLSSNLQLHRLIGGVGYLTKRTAYAFLLLLVRLDMCSLERVVDLLILLHHSHDPVQANLYSTVSSAGPSSTIPTPDNLSGQSSPRVSQVLLSDDSVGKARSLQLTPKGINWDVQPALVGRNESGFVGLRNGGATCYMNAVLQQLFMQPGLAEALLSIQDTDDLDENNILFQTQKLFGCLLESQLEYYDPVGFWKSFRPWDTSEAVNPREQQDAFDFFQALIDQLDEELKKIKREPFFQAIYQGIFLDSKFCDECEHRYDREEVFCAINLAVRVHDLQEALNQFVRGEVLDGDNAYYCERCHMKRRTVKRMSVHTLPPVLCLHLKRFDFDWDRQVSIKFSDHFTFPRQLDMSPYMADSVQKLRPEAFFSPSSSTSSLLQREARMAVPTINKKDFHLSDNELSEEASHGSNSTELEPRKLPQSTATPSIQLPDNVFSDGTSERSATGFDVPSNPHTNTGLGKRTHTTGIPSLTSSTTKHLYRLVGIIVHSGQANSGHYYAFIKDRGRGDMIKSAATVSPSHMSDGTDKTNTKERPQNSSAIMSEHLSGINRTGSVKSSTSSTQEKASAASDRSTDGLWYRFNDTSVEPVELDDALLEHECFGGTYKVTSSDGRSVERRTRYWSAYMLFYERADLNHTALRQSLMTKRSIPRDDSHANVVSPRGDNSADITWSGSFDNVNQCSDHKRGDFEHDATSVSSLMRTESTMSYHMPKRIANQIWADNWAFLRDRNIFSRDYFDAIRGICEGILLDSSSLRQEPQRGVIGTRLLAHFIFHTFLCLHPRTKLSIEGCMADAQGASSSALKDMAAQLNSEWFALLLRLASTNPKACRWLMHFLYTSPTQPCLVFMLLAPKPSVRQLLANTLLTVLRTFYSFRETNILDGTLTGLVNHLLSFLDSGIAAEYATQAGALFALLRGYVEMCPHASLHLINLKTTKRLLNYLMEPQSRGGSYTSTCTTGGSFVACAPTWSDRLRSWTPAQQREMGNLYYLLGLLILQTSLDEFCTIRPTCSSPAHPVLLTVPNTIGSSSTKQVSWGRLMLRPHKETVIWLGVSPLIKRVSNIATVSGVSSSVSGAKSPGSKAQSHPFRSVPNEQRCEPETTDDTYLVGLFRLCEVLLRAYLENAATPNLASSQGVTEVGRNLPSGTSSVTNTTGTSGSGGRAVSVTAASAVGAGSKLPSSQAAGKVGEDSVSLRQLIIQCMLHMTHCSWESSFCFIITLLLRIETRPQSELRHLFDLLNELLCLVDPLQSARIAAVMHGLTNRPNTEENGHRWCPRPNVDPHLWAWSTKELDLSLQSKSSSDHERICQPQAIDPNETSDAVMSEAEDSADSWPSMPKGLLELITSEAYQDSRRAYQCMKFIVHLSSKTDAVMSYLSGFPDRWEPAVRWLENLMESTDDSGPPRGTGRMDGTTDHLGLDEGDGGALYMVLTSESMRRVVNLTDASNESEENTAGFQRTVSAQTTLREATRILFTMPRMRREPTGLSALPVNGHDAHRDLDADDDDDDYQSRQNTPLFYKLTS